jgi:choline-sulfatase
VRYFDNPRFWSSPPAPGVQPQDVVVAPPPRLPAQDGQYTLPYQVMVKSTPLPDEFEMYDVSADPMELSNLAADPAYAACRAQLLQLLEEQRRAKRLLPAPVQRHP